MKKVSVIIPIYNCEKFLDECFLSIIEQDYKNIEILAIDDGSTDKSREICLRYENKYKFFHFFSQPNFGAPAARNKGIEHATGEYVIFFDSDDVMESNAISNLVNCLEKNESDIVIGKVNEIDEKGNYLRQKPYGVRINFEKYDFMSCDPYPGNKIYKMKIIKDNNLIFDNVRIGQDLNFYLKYCIYVNKLTYIDKLICCYRILKTGITKSYDFRIMDIVESLNKVEKCYIYNNADKIMKDNLEILKLFYYNRQLSKIYFIMDKNIKNVITEYFFFYWKTNKQRKNYNFPFIKKIKTKMKLKKILISKMFYIIKHFKGKE